MNCHEVSMLIDPYVDDEAATHEADAIRTHLAECSACAAQLHQRESLRRLLRGLPYYSAPDRLRARIVSAHGQMRTSIIRGRLAWAASLLLIVGAGAVVFHGVATSRATAALADAVVDRHVASLMSNALVNVRSSSQHTVKPWFQGKINFSPPVVDLGAAGFPLIGGRVDTIGARRVAVIVFSRRDHVINLFIWPADDGGKSQDARTIRGFQERHWRQAQMSLWAVSDLNSQELSSFANAFQEASR